jgi:hypothetical protein
MSAHCASQSTSVLHRLPNLNHRSTPRREGSKRESNLCDEAREGGPGRNAAAPGSEKAAIMAISTGRIVEIMSVGGRKGPILGASLTPVILSGVGKFLSQI